MDAAVEVKLNQAAAVKRLKLVPGSYTRPVKAPKTTVPSFNDVLDRLVEEGAISQHLADNMAAKWISYLRAFCCITEVFDYIANLLAASQTQYLLRGEL